MMVVFVLDCLIHAQLYNSLNFYNMVLYLTENTLNEAVSSQSIVDALNKRQGVWINYASEDGHTGKRYIEPYVYGVTKAGNDAIRAFQYNGDTKRGVPHWKLFRVDRISTWEPTNNIFETEPKARGWAAEAWNNNGDKSLTRIYNIVNFNDKTKTNKTSSESQNSWSSRFKKMKDKIKNVISSFFGSKKNNPKQQVTTSTPSGPITPITPFNNQKKTNTPTSYANIEQTSIEPQVNGPITDDTTEIENNNIMSNDEFKNKIQSDFDIEEEDNEN